MSHLFTDENGDPYCQAVLQSRFRDGGLEEAPIWDNVKTFDGRVAKDQRHSGGSMKKVITFDGNSYLLPDSLDACEMLMDMAKLVPLRVIYHGGVDQYKIKGRMALLELKIVDESSFLPVTNVIETQVMAAAGCESGGTDSVVAESEKAL